MLPGEQIDSVQWIFQNNGTSKESNPEKLFSTNGEFEVTQIAYASNECKDTINQTITIPQTVSLPQTNILSPSQGEKIFENAVLLSWTAEDAISYSVETSVDSEFSTSTILEILTNQYLEYDISSIANKDSLWWRVIAINECGDEVKSETNFFIVSSIEQIAPLPYGIVQILYI